MNFSGPTPAAILRKLTVFFVFFYIFISFLTIDALGPDTVWHLKTGEYIYSTKTLPESDPFSFADDDIPFIGKFILTQYWLSQIIFSLIYKALGAFGLILLGAGIFTGILMLLWMLIRDKGFYISFVIAGGFAFVMLRNFPEIRPQILTFFFSTLVIFLIERYRESASIKYIFPLPPLMLLWANMHGGFIYGAVLIAIYALSEGIQFYTGFNKTRTIPGPSSGKFYPFVFLCIFSILISLLNPNSYKAFQYAFITHSRHLFAMLQEYHSPYHHLKFNPTLLIYGFWFYLFISIVMAVSFIKNRRLLPFFLILFSATPALISVRYIALFIIVATSTFRYVPVRMKIKLPSKIDAGFSLAIILFLIFLISRSDPLKGDLNRFHERPIYPVRATDFLIKNKISGNIFSSYNVSAFIMFRLFPESRVYSDSRYINEKRVEKNSRIEGAFEPIEETIQNINALAPHNLGKFIKIDTPVYGENSPGPDPLANRADTDDDKDWKELLDEIKAEIIVHEAVNYFSGHIYPFVFKLIQDNTWKMIYLDENVMIFVRDIQKYRDIITKFDKPKFLIYSEIIKETLKINNKNTSSYFSNIALGLLLRGIADDNTKSFIDKALLRNPSDPIAIYCKALYEVMNR